MYQRRVKTTFTRLEAEVVRQALLRLSADPVARANAGLDGTKTTASRCRNAWKKIDRSVQRRDEAMRAKQSGRDDDEALHIDKDVPLEGL